MINQIFNEDCFDTIKKLKENKIYPNIILTSPPYNTNVKAGKHGTNQNTKLKDDAYHYIRYDGYVDTLTNEEYIEMTVNLFNELDNILAKNGVILYNMSYGSENAEAMPLAISNIIERTNFTMIDIIVWKKKTAFPNVCSPNKLTRIVEFIFVICRKNEIKTFQANKQKRGVRDTGQQMYNSVINFIEAPNNDGSNKYNKATFSSELVYKLLSMYAKKDNIVYDPFIGTGTTAIGCLQYGCNYIGSELSENQVKFANERIKDFSIKSIDKPLFTC